MVYTRMIIDMDCKLSKLNQSLLQQWAKESVQLAQKGKLLKIINSIPFSLMELTSP